MKKIHALLSLLCTLFSPLLADGAHEAHNTPATITGELVYKQRSG